MITMLSPQMLNPSSSNPRLLKPKWRFTGKWTRVGFIENWRSILGSSLIRMSSRPRSTLLLLVSLLSLVSVLVLVRETGPISLMRISSRPTSREPPTVAIVLIVQGLGIFGALISYLRCDKGGGTQALMRTSRIQ